MKTGSQPNLVILNQMAGPMTWEFAVDAAAQLGCVALLLVMGMLIVACLEVARRAREPQGRLIAIGVISLIGFQAVVNLWVAVGLLPTTGVTLPFVSYGGSSLLSSFIGIGLVVNVGLRRHSSLARDPFSR